MLVEGLHLLVPRGHDPVLAVELLTCRRMSWWFIQNDRKKRNRWRICTFKVFAHLIQDFSDLTVLNVHQATSIGTYFANVSGVAEWEHGQHSHTTGRNS
jgi:hypothetical protein